MIKLHNLIFYSIAFTLLLRVPISGNFKGVKFTFSIGKIVNSTELTIHRRDCIIGFSCQRQTKFLHAQCKLLC